MPKPDTLVPAMLPLLLMEPAPPPMKMPLANAVMDADSELVTVPPDARLTPSLPAPVALTVPLLTRVQAVPPGPATAAPLATVSPIEAVLPMVDGLTSKVRPLA